MKTFFCILLILHSLVLSLLHDEEEQNQNSILSHLGTEQMKQSVVLGNYFYLTFFFNFPLKKVLLYLVHFIFHSPLLHEEDK